jgi:formylmethanofuran dehydrogenase subunit C
MPFSPPTISGKVCRDTTLIEPYRKISLLSVSATMPGIGLSQSTTVTISSKVCRGSGSDAGRYRATKYAILWGSATGVSVPAGSIIITGYAPRAFGGPIPTGRLLITGYAPSEPGIPAGSIIITGYPPLIPIAIPAGGIKITGIPLLFAGTTAVPAGAIVISGKAPTVTNYIDTAGQISCCTVPDESLGGVSSELQNWAL